ncbi:MAG: hypothetical protein CMJ80_00450 [Planctomycetaceae bacterium]|nr:hypothetical protein [Planctomycetaceae bacterium]
MKSIVIGGMGFIGAEIVRELVNRNNHVLVLDRNGSQELCDVVFGTGKVESITGDILDKKTLSNAFVGCDEVYHLAGKLGTSELDDSIKDAIDVNITGTINVFQSALEANVNRIFYPSKPNVWLNTYTITKYTSEQFAKLFNQEYPIEIYSLRYFNAYGPRQHTLPIRKIIPIFAIQSIRKMPIQVYGNGKQTVDMIYSKDLAKLTVDFMKTGFTEEVLDCGTGIELEVNEVANLVNKITGNHAGIEHLPMRKGETPNTKLAADIKPLLDLLSEFQFSEWEESLEDTISYYANLPSEEIDKVCKFYGF